MIAACRAQALTGDDDAHELPKDVKDKLERALRKEGRELFRKTGDAKAKKERESRAANISRKPSKRAQHH